MRKGKRKGIMKGVPEWRAQGGFIGITVERINHNMLDNGTAVVTRRDGIRCVLTN